MSHADAHLWSELLAGDLVDAIAVPAWLYRRGAPLRANPALQRLSGLSAPSLQRTEHLALVVPDDRQALDAATEECLHGSGEPPAQGAQLLTANGSVRPVELTLRRVWLGRPGAEAHAGGPGLEAAPGPEAAALITCVDLSDFQHVQNMMLGMSGLLRQIIDGAPVASYVIDRNHRITHWNAACEHLTGRSADDMIGCTQAWQAFYPDPRPMLADLMVDGLRDEALVARCPEPAVPSALVAGAYETEAFFPALGAEGRWLHFTAAPLSGPDGQGQGAVVTLQDVSQRRRTEAELTRRLERLVEERSAELAAHARVLDAFIDNAPIGVVYARGEQVLRSNRRMAEIFGLGRAAEPQAVPQSAPQTAAQTAAPEGAASPRADAAVPLHEADFHLGPQDLDTLRRIARPQLVRGEPLHHEMWMRHADGRPIWVQLNAFVVEQGQPEAGVWWMLQDRTEVRAAQEELRSRYDELKATHEKLAQAQNQLLQQDKMASIGQLAAGVAHEINNPVGFVASNLRTLRQYVQSLLALVDVQDRARAAVGATGAAALPAELLAELRRVHKAAELDYLKEDLPQLLDESDDGLARVKKIVQDLKDFSRVDHSDWQQADLNAGLDSTLNVVRNEVKYKCEVVKRLQPLPLVTCLAGQLNQVFMNLIVNASQAITGHGTITLSSGVQDAWVWVQVDDTGCGMPEEVRRRVFEPFFTTKDVGKGTGLGLSLSFSIVQRHGGTLQVRSVPGQGSRFRVWVPVAGPATPAPGQAAPQPPEWPDEPAADPAAAGRGA